MARPVALLLLCCVWRVTAQPPPPGPPSPPPYTTPPGEGSVVLTSEGLGASSDALGEGFSFLNYSALGVSNGEARALSAAPPGPTARLLRRAQPQADSPGRPGV